ncbi:hypothetical protein [Gaopeijia maritima]|uniref:hypothetical protein n=1 Tax=Gaopeijia maritima TaxID=3119007 RepID=UPI00328B6345
MKFTKIKYNPKEPKVTIRWEESRKGGAETLRHGIDSKDRPEPAFIDALEAFIPEVCRLLDLPADYGKGMAVRGVSINHEEDLRRGLVITLLKGLLDANAPLIINTPHLRESDGEDSGVFASAAMIKRLDNLERMAQRYIDGHREQSDLFLGGSDLADEVAGALSDAGVLEPA